LSSLEKQHENAYGIRLFAKSNDYSFSTMSMSSLVSDLPASVLVSTGAFLLFGSGLVFVMIQSKRGERPGLAR
jgi:hypothetical protein